MIKGGGVIELRVIEGVCDVRGLAVTEVREVRRGKTETVNWSSS